MARSLEAATSQSLDTDPLTGDAEANLTQDDPAPARQSHFPVKKLSLVGAVLVAVFFVATRMGDDKVLSKSGSANQALDLDAIATLDTVNMDPKIGAVMKALGAWGKGLLHGDKCEENAKKVWTEDIVWDFRGMKGLGIYEGIKEGCQLVKDLEYYTFDGFKVSNNPYVSGDEVKLTTSVTPGIHSGLFMHKIEDGQIWTVRDGKVAGMKTVPSEPQVWNALKGDIEPPEVTDDVKVVGAIFAAWGKGELHGEKCKAASAKFVTDDVMQNAAAPAKNTDMFRVYHGLDGWCDWIVNLEKFAFSDFKPSFSSKAPGLVSVSVTYNVNLAGNDDGENGKLKGKHDLQLWSVKDGKVTKVDFLFGDVAGMDALFA